MSTVFNTLHIPSRVQRFVFKGRTFYVKRDDEIAPFLSGNKYWKLYSLIQTNAAVYHTIISYGGIQSNAMLSMAALCSEKGWQFHYYSKPVPHRLQHQPSGNLKHALAIGMQLHEVAHEDYNATITRLKSIHEPKTLLISQGAADPIAEHGIQHLAAEINLWQQQQGITKLNIVTPSGTGTTAYYLAKALPNLHIFTTSAVGDNHYLAQQMRQLGHLPENLVLLKPVRKYHFAKPYPEFVSMYHDLKASGITFDLIYAPKMWQTLLHDQNRLQGEVLYIHSGGLMGNATMLERYAFLSNPA